MTLFIWFLLTFTVFNVSGGDSSCSTEAPMKCIVPHVQDYVGLDQASMMKKFVNDPLKVPCEKIAKTTSCFKKEFPSCSYADIFMGSQPMPPDPRGDYAAGGRADKGLDMFLNYICVEEYTVFNDAKNCLMTRAHEIGNKMVVNNCKPPVGMDKPEEIKKQLCANVESNAMVKCAFDSVAEVCGKPLIEKTKTLFRKMCELDQNIAFAKSTAQSSTWDETSGSSKAVDGNPNPDYYVGKSCSHTLYDEFAWWSVDIGCDARIDTVIITNRGDNQLGHRLHDFNVGVSDKDPRVTAPRPSNYKLCGTFKGPARDGATLPFSCNENVNSGRYVIVQMPTSKNYLHICEVAVIGECKNLGANLAYGKKTIQSSTHGSGVSSKAVDGNNNPDYSIGSCIHTENDANAWWAVDLDCAARIDNIAVTNRGDNKLGSRLHDFNVGITDTNPSVTSPRPSNYKLCGTHQGPAKDGATITFTCKNITALGRYVVIQMPGETKNFLHICEVVVNGKCNKRNSVFDFMKRTAMSYLR